MNSKVGGTEPRNQYNLEQNDFFIRRTSNRFIMNSIISMVFLYIGSLIDTLLVGMYLSEDGLAAMSLISPVYLVFYTVGATIGIGASTNASRVLGRAELNEYRKVFSVAVILLTVSAVVMTLAGYLLIDPFVSFLCGDVPAVQIEMAKNYLLYYIPGGALTLVSYIPLYFLKTEGKPTLSARLFTMSAIVNILLSWLFISPVFNMGTAGPALATSLSFLCVVLVGFFYLFRGDTELRFERDCMEWERIREILLAGLPNGAANLLESARIYFVNMLLIFSGAALMLSCYTVVRNVNDILNAVIIGLSSAMIPLIGVFFGERDYEGERIVMKRSMKFGLTVMAILTVVVSVFPDPFFRLFGVSDPVIIEEGRWAIPLSCFGLVAAYANTLYISYLTAIKREGIATVMVALRLLVMLILFALPLSHLIGTKGVWLSFSLSEIATYAVFCLIRLAIQNKDPNLDRYLLDTSKEKIGDISFAVRNSPEEIVKASETIGTFCEDHEIDMKRTMRVSVALEEILTFLFSHCLNDENENYVSVRVCKLDEEVMVRFRYVGKIYDPMDYYQNNKDNEDLTEDLLGLKLVTKSASLVNFQKTLGTNNLMLVF